MANPISEKQLAANRANAKKSPGPTSPEGKKRSSQNALDDGKWAKEVVPIPAGPFREDPVKFYERVEEIMADFKPVGTAQMVAAKRAAAALMRLDRTDRAEAAIICETDRLEGMERDLYPDPDQFFEHVMNIETVVANISYIAGSTTDDDDDRPPWMCLAAYLLGYGPKSRPGVEEHPTPKPLLPETEEECQELAQTLYHRHWTTEQDCLFYFMRKLGDAERAYARATDRYNALMAKRLLGVSTDHVDRPRTAAWTEFNRAYTLLRKLQAADAEEE